MHTQQYKLIKAFRIIAQCDPLWLRALGCGVAAAVEHVPVLRQLNNVRTVIDIGANRGQFALAARHCYPKARIISFEPLPLPALTFERIFAKDDNITLYRIAIGPKKGKAEIHVSARDDSSSLLPITETQEKIFPGTAETGTYTIEISRLSDIITGYDIDQPALLKLDVQGFEIEALKGCEALLHQFFWVYVECSFIELYKGQPLAGDVIAWLRERGLDLCGVYNIFYGPSSKAVQADFLFSKNFSRTDRLPS